jgi:hypothetical protein
MRSQPADVHRGQRPCAPREQAGHMTASIPISSINFSLASRGPSTHGSSRQPRARRHGPAGRRRARRPGHPSNKFDGNLSRSLAAKAGSVESLNCRTRCGCRPCPRQIRCTDEMLIAATLLMAAAVQCVVSPGGSPCVRATTRAATSGPSRGMRAGRVLSRRSPSTPSCAKRSCQRQTTVLDTPAPRMIACVPSPSALSRTIRARQTCFCGVFRSAATASSRRRSGAESVKEMPLRIPPDSQDGPQTETPHGLNRQGSTTRVLSQSSVNPAIALRLYLIRIHLIMQTSASFQNGSFGLGPP